MMTLPTRNPSTAPRRSGEWLDDARRVALLDVATALGLDVRRDGKSFGPCPGCGEATRGKDKRGRCRVTPEGNGWACCSNGSDGCGAKGDGVALVAWKLTDKAWAKGDRETSARVREWYAARGWCEAWTGGGSALPTPARPRIAPVARVVPAPPQRPDPEQVRALWARCVPVTDDPAVAAWLTGRNDPGPIDPAAVAALDLARALPAELVGLPGWARFNGQPWTASGHRLIVRAWEADPDNAGRLRVASLHARNVLPDCAGKDKAAWPAGATAAALILATGPDPRAHGLDLIEIPEGVPDWLRLVLTRAELPKGERPAVWGAWSGSPDPEVAAVVPEGWTVALRFHADDAGDKYADRWCELLAPRGCIMRRQRKVNDPQPAEPIHPVHPADPPCPAPAMPADLADPVEAACEAVRDAPDPTGLAVVWACCCRQWGGADLVPAAVAGVLRCRLDDLDGWEMGEYRAKLRELGVT